MDDIVLVTADSVRRDYVDHLPYVSSLDVRTGYAGAHYTRPSLSSLVSPSFESAIRSRPVNPTVAEALSDLGYHCIGLAPGPQLDEDFGFADGFDEYDSFYEGSGNPVKDRTSKVREYFGSFEIVRDVYRTFFPMGAVLEDIPSDGELVDEAIERFNDAPEPRFLWVHLMETHRPYGTGEDAVPTDLDRKSERLGGGLFSPSELTEEEAATIEEKYRDALERAGHEIERLVENVEGDPTVVFCSDHGEELGEDGYYYHQGYRRRVPDRIVQVPVAFDGLEVEADPLSLLDVAPTLVAAAGGEPPSSWHGRNVLEEDVSWAMTIAPWNDTATTRWTDFETSIVSRDADVSLLESDGRVDVEATEVSEDIEQRLQDLGYTSAG